MFQFIVFYNRQRWFIHRLIIYLTLTFTGVDGLMLLVKRMAGKICRKVAMTFSYIVHVLKPDRSL